VRQLGDFLAGAVDAFLSAGNLRAGLAGMFDGVFNVHGMSPIASPMRCIDPVICAISVN
jgi:hypothetical protein